ncbi:hypothetical protein CCR85_02610 [Rhodothalassium salexigens]|uniref:hypothetical protein n=1 Tax=Rhodothalassium salexigens TaxID=1086 RepID=UPI001914C2A7|nr:hypothetical protein [Rhodothalassium salexigens]MBK5910382.1 hypothetical protein [Rhodothalassium salexigens]
MKIWQKVLLGGAAAVAMTGAANAQATDTITLDVTQNGTGDVATEVNLVETAVLAGQTGVLEITITPNNGGGTDPWGVSGLSAAGFVTLTYTNAVFGNPVSETVVGGTTGTCGSSVTPVTASSTASTVTFEVANIEECDGQGPNGVLQIEVPFALSSLADANFSVGVTTVNATLADTTAYEVNGGPLVETGPAYTLAFDTDNPDVAGNRQLALGLDPAFSAFDTAGTDTDAILGEFKLTAGFAAADLQGTAVSAPQDLALSITAQDAAGIQDFVVENGGGTDVTLSRVGTTNEFTGTVSGAVTVADFADSAVTVNLTGTDTVAAQTFTPTASVTADTATIEQTAAALEGITRDGSPSANFSWVALEDVTASQNVFRFKGLTEGDRIIASVSELNTGEAAASLDITSDVTVSAGGEAVLTGAQLGDLFTAAALIDNTAAGVTRGTVDFTVEAEAVNVERLLFSGNGGITTMDDDDLRSGVLNP